MKSEFLAIDRHEHGYSRGYPALVLAEMTMPTDSAGGLFGNIAREVF
jgi:hypothetical protein